ncbi:MAG: hypothetical protein M3353_07195, partial [Actinomycetota bacterium]|nr:hypothetical protein [Actinomycetota bacterium]
MTIPAAMFASADAGLHDLPIEVARRRAAVARIAEARTKHGAPPDVAGLDETAACELAEAACDKAPTVDVSTLVAADEERSRHERTSRILNRAALLADGQLVDALHAYGDELIRDHMVPAYTRAVEQARGACTAYLPFGASAASMLTAPSKAQAAWRKVDDLAAVVTMLRDSRGRLLRLTGPPQSDEMGLFSVVRNAEQIHPDIATAARYTLTGR